MIKRLEIGKIILWSYEEQCVCFISKKTGSDGEGYEIVMHVHVNPEKPKTTKTKSSTQDNKDTSCRIFWDGGASRLIRWILIFLSIGKFSQRERIKRLYHNKVYLPKPISHFSIIIHSISATWCYLLSIFLKMICRVNVCMKFYANQVNFFRLLFHASNTNTNTSS